MGITTVVFELTDGEIRAFWFSVPPALTFKQGNSSKVVKFDRIPIPTGIVEQGNVRNECVLIDLLSTYGSRHPKEKHKAFLAIPLQQGFVRAYLLPWLPKRDRTSAIALLVDEEISIERPNLLYDFQVLSEERHKGLRILLGATRQSVLAQYVFIFEQAGFEISGVDFALSVLGHALEFKPNEDVLYLQGESGCFQVTLFRGGVPENVRTFLPLPSVEGCHGSERDRIEEVEEEIRRFLLYYQTQQTDLNLKRLVWSGDSGTEKLANRLVESEYVMSSDQAKLKDVPDAWHQILKDNVGRIEVVSGYGQQVLMDQPILNLWHEASKAKKTKQRYLGLSAFSGALLVMGTILWFMMHQMSLSLQREVKILASQGAQIVGQAQHQHNLEAVWNTALIRTEKMGEGLIQVQALSCSGLKVEQVVYKRGSMSLSGISNEAGEVQTLILTLRTMGWEPALTSYKLTTLNKVEFSISAKRERLGNQSQPTTN